MQRLSLAAVVLIATLLIASCAFKTSPAGINRPNQQADSNAQEAAYAGRIGLQIQSDPPQAFFAGFELSGSALNGRLALVNPLGGTVGVMRWTPGEATLEQGGAVRRFASTDDLLLQTTGAAVPLSTLFDWLAGINSTAVGWVADLSQHAGGKVTAKRESPAPQANLRIVLDKPQ